eukprot:1934620-Pyramimonas_sp.AAC.2
MDAQSWHAEFNVQDGKPRSPAFSRGSEAPSSCIVAEVGCIVAEALFLMTAAVRPVALTAPG